MRTRILSLLIVVLLLGATPSVAQLPPEILADSHLLRAEQAIRDEDPTRARAEIDQIILLGRETELDLSDEFHLRHSKVAAAAGLPDRALEAVMKYLTSAGREGEHYVEALELMNQAQDEIAGRKGLQGASPVPPPRVSAASPAEAQLGAREIPETPEEQEAHLHVAAMTESPPATDCDLRQWDTGLFFRTATVEVVKACVAAGANPKAHGVSNRTPLHWAAWYNKNPAVVQALVAGGADPNARDNFKSTPLHRAAEHNKNPEVLKALLDAGADPNAQDISKNTPLDNAKERRNRAAIEILSPLTAVGKSQPVAVHAEKGGFDCGRTGVTKDWTGRNLRKAKLEGENLSGFNLSGADLEKAKLRNADLRGANLEKAKLRKADLRGANLCEANLRGADLYKTDLRGADLRGADLYKTDLNKAKLNKANLHKADLRGAKVRNLTAYNANLSGANLRGAYVRKAYLNGANLRNADLHKANLSGKSAWGGGVVFNTSLYEADLQGANLSEADLLGADLGRADLSRANLRGANLSKAYLNGANLRNADLRGGNFYEANFSKADLRGADLRGANLHKAKDLHKANFQGANLSGVIRRGTRQNSGPGALGAAIGIIGGTAIAAAGGGSEEAVAAGTVFAEGVISGQSPAGSTTSAPSVVPTGNVGGGGGQCEIPGYPRPTNVQTLGLSWCPATVDFQARAFALQAAGAQCAIATGSSSTPDQIQARRQEIQAACARLAALGVSNCRCP